LADTRPFFATVNSENERAEALAILRLTSSPAAFVALAGPVAFMSERGSVSHLPSILALDATACAVDFPIRSPSTEVDAETSFHLGQPDKPTMGDLKRICLKLNYPGSKVEKA
jgi:hypothetical protein